MWHVTTHTRLGTLKTGGNRVFALAFDPRGATLAIGGDCVTKLWDIAPQQERRTLVTHPHHTMFDLAFSGDGNLLVTAMGNEHDRTGACSLWNTDNGEEIATLIRGWNDPAPRRGTGR